MEVVTLHTGENGNRNLLDLCGCQDEDSIARRLLNGLQQRIEGTGT